MLKMQHLLISVSSYICKPKLKRKHYESVFNYKLALLTLLPNLDAWDA